MKEAIEKLRAEESSLFNDKLAIEERIKKIKSAIEALQSLCKHDMQQDGHDSHKTYYKCSICGYENNY